MKVTAEADDVGLRLDVWLSRRLPDISRTRVKSLITGGHVSSDAGALTPKTRVAAGLTVCVNPPPVQESELLPEAIPLTILFEDHDIIVISKPAGLVVHPAVGHESGTLVNALLHHCPDLAGIGGEKRPGIVHRLDKDTSGVMVAAKNEHAMEALSRQFHDHLVKKTYLAIAWGCPVPSQGTIETEIGRSQHDRQKMTARPRRGGRDAVSHYRALRRWPELTEMEVRIETGRTHQIRVHLSHIGHPIVGDPQYGRRNPPPLPHVVGRQMLHAQRLAFRHPVSGEALEFVAPMAEDMCELINALGAPLRTRPVDGHRRPGRTAGDRG